MPKAIYARPRGISGGCIINMKTKECPICKNGYYIKETYGLDGGDEYTSSEKGHKGDCPRYEVDPKNVRYIN